MKTITFLMVMLMSASVVFAQPNKKKIQKVRKAPAVRIDASKVPQAVKDAHTKQFSSITNVKWKMKTVRTKKGPAKDFIAAFKDGDTKANAHYKGDGTPVVIIHHLPANKVPANIVSKVSSNYSGFTLKRGTKIKAIAKNRVVYRLILTKPAAKLVLFVDESGNDAQKINEVKEALDDVDSNSEMEMEEE